MNKKHLIVGISLSLVAISALVVCFILIAKPFTPTGDGKIKIEYVALDGEIIKEKEVTYYEGDTLEKLIKDNFNNVLFDDGMIMEIEDFKTNTLTWDPFILIYVDGNMSMVGYNEINFTDGTVISLRITAFEPQ